MNLTKNKVIACISLMSLCELSEENIKTNIPQCDSDM